MIHSYNKSQQIWEIVHLVGLYSKNEAQSFTRTESYSNGKQFSWDLQNRKTDYYVENSPMVFHVTLQHYLFNVCKVHSTLLCLHFVSCAFSWGFPPHAIYTNCILLRTINYYYTVFVTVSTTHGSSKSRNWTAKSAEAASFRQRGFDGGSRPP